MLEHIYDISAKPPKRNNMYIYIYTMWYAYNIIILYYSFLYIFSKYICFNLCIYEYIYTLESVNNYVGILH